MNEQFSRLEMLLGEAAIERLHQSHVAVFGLGGVGGYTVECLTRAGVGKLTLIDQDTVGLSNLNRQIGALHSTLDMPKAEALARRVADINPACVTVPLVARYEAEQRGDFFPCTFDFIVDAIDTVSCKLDLIATAQAQGVPMISSMGTGNKLDGSQLRIADISKTEGCALARVVRKELRNRGISRHTVVYSPELPQKPGETNETPPPGRRSIPASTPWVPAMAGMLLAQHVILTLTKE